MVRAFYAAALEIGGRDRGNSGLCTHYCKLLNPHPLPDFATIRNRWRSLSE
jgi:hypothetical protein